MKGKYITRSIQLACLATDKPKSDTEQKKAIDPDFDERANNCTADNDTTGNNWLVFGGSDVS